MSQKTRKVGHQKQGFSREKQTRLDILRAISNNTGLLKVQVESVFLELSELLNSHMHKRGSGEFTIPMTGIKVLRVKKRATRSRTMLSPLTGQEVFVPGKPGRLAIKLSALKPLKEAVLD